MESSNRLAGSSDGNPPAHYASRRALQVDAIGDRMVRSPSGASADARGGQTPLQRRRHESRAHRTVAVSVIGTKGKASRRHQPTEAQTRKRGLKWKTSQGAALWRLPAQWVSWAQPQPASPASREAPPPNRRKPTRPPRTPRPAAGWALPSKSSWSETPTCLWRSSTAAAASMWMPRPNTPWPTARSYPRYS